mgnify:FL=1
MPLYWTWNDAGALSHKGVLSHFMDDFKEPAKKIAASGKLLMYHNHNTEFEAFEAENLPNANYEKTHD